jgi:hypothetical protein
MRDQVKQNEGKKRHADKKRDLMRALKDKPCSDCGVSYPSHVMDFDHVRGEKTFNISRALRVSKEKLLEEIEKCEVVCANCHRIRTYERRTAI